MMKNNIKKTLISLKWSLIMNNNNPQLNEKDMLIIRQAEKIVSEKRKTTPEFRDEVISASNRIFSQMISISKKEIPNTHKIIANVPKNIDKNLVNLNFGGLNFNDGDESISYFNIYDYFGQKIGMMFVDENYFTHVIPLINYNRRIN